MALAGTAAARAAAARGRAAGAAAGARAMEDIMEVAIAVCVLQKDERADEGRAWPKPDERPAARSCSGYQCLALPRHHVSAAS